MTGSRKELVSSERGSVDPVLLHISPEGVATITLNRPHVHNAYDDEMLARLSDVCVELDSRKDIRAVVLKGAGRTFCAGADLNWMQRSAALSDEDNLIDAVRIAEAFRQLHNMPWPTIAAVQGSCLGGALGLVAACDVVVATRSAWFGLTEVRHGLVPNVVSPYVIAAVGARAARYHCLTGALFDGAEAYRIGLVHEIVDDESSLRNMCDRVLSNVLAGAPGAIRASKALIARFEDPPFDEEMRAETARGAAESRTGAEGREGVTAFLQKRPPNWVRDWPK